MRTHSHSFDNRVESVHPRLRRILIAGDAVAALLAWTLPSLVPGSLLGDELAGPSLGGMTLAIGTIIAVVAFTLALLATERLYLSRVCSMRSVEISRLGRAAVVIGIATLLVDKALGEAHLARVPIATAILSFVLLNFWRVGYTSWINNARRQDRFTRSVILIGGNDEAFGLYDHLRRHPELGYRVRGVVGKANDVEKHDFDVPWMGETPNLPAVLTRTGVKGAIVAGGALGRPQLNVAIRQLLEHQVHVHMSTGINGIDHRRLQSHSLAYEPMVYVEQTDLEGWQVVVKRAQDIAIAGVTLLLTSPLWVVSALLVKLHDRGPVFFKQERIGRDGRPFTILKLRSMVVDAEAQQVDLRDQNEREGPLFKLTFDPRVTGIGRFIRATSIDELPQLLNVIRGDMSLVGPRPALPSEVANFEDAHLARQNVLPGITGLWQVEARDNPDFGLYERLDVFYVENWSVALDFSILLRTARVVLVRSWSAFGKLRHKVAG